jgi:transposase
MRSTSPSTSTEFAGDPYLPPYSPDLNPIEQALAQLKTLLRKQNARTIPQVEAWIARLLAELTLQQGRNYFREAGYAST